MKPNDLRIGNYILFPTGAMHGLLIPCIQRRVDAIIFWGVISINSPQSPSNFEANLNNCAPIPLTEEWLVKFGFEKRGIRFNKNGLLLWEDNGKYIFALFESESKTERNTILKYVHQLQNLYFALTGTELEF